MKRYLKVISIGLILCMLLQIVSVVATAESKVTTDVKEEVYVVSEVESLRTETEKHFLMSDGTYMAASYEIPIHYNDNGVWNDINNSLVENKNGQLVNIDSKFDVKLSKKLNNKPVELNFNGNKISWGYIGYNDTQATVLRNKKQDVNNKFELESLTSSTKYTNAFDDVDIEFVVTPIGVKENIIVKSSKAKTSFDLEYNFNNLKVKKIDDQTIDLLNHNDKIIYTINAPVMFDAAGEISDALTLKINSQSENRLNLTITADEKWISDKERQFPVTVDPSVVVENSGNMEFCSVWSSLGYDSSYAMAGTVETDLGPEELVGVIRINSLPYLGPGGHVKEARLQLPVENFGGKLSLYNSNYTGSLPSLTMNALNNSLSEHPVDLYYDDPCGSITTNFNVTIPIQDFYNNNGTTLAVKSVNGKLNTINTFDSSNVPRLIITYINQTGIHDKYSYQTQNAGRAGNVFVNNLTGQLALHRIDFSYDSKDLPVQAGMIYAPSYNTTSLEYGWKNIYTDKIYRTQNSSGETNYVWESGNGNIFYFTQRKTETLESGTTVIYFPDDTGFGYKYYPSSNKITSEDGTVYLYCITSNNDRILIGISDEEYKVENDYYSKQISIEYDSSDTIIRNVYDGDGNRYYYSYNLNGKLQKIHYCGKGSTNYDEVVFSYSGDLLTGVNYNGEISTYSYNSGKLATVTSPGGYRLAYTYDNHSRVKTISEQAYNGSSYINGNKLTVTYGNDSTTYTDSNSNKEIYIFDGNGYVATVMNEDGLAISQKHDSNGKLLAQTDITVPVVNHLNGTSFEQGFDDWNLIDDAEHFSISSEKAYVGSNSAKFYSTTQNRTAYLNCNLVNLEPGTYTLSTYVLTENLESNDGITLRARRSDGTVKKTYKTNKNYDDWQRLELTFNVSESESSVRVDIGVKNAKGTVYFDAAQLEKHKRAYSYNMVSNSDFRNGYTYSWGLSENAVIETQNDTPGGLDNHVLAMHGALHQTETAVNTVVANAKAGNSFTFSAWLKAKGTLPSYKIIDNNDTLAEISLYGIKNLEGSTEAINLGDYTINHKLQYKWYKFAETITLDEDVDEIRIVIKYKHQNGVLYIDGVELTPDGFEVVVDAPVEDESGGDGDEEDNEDENYINFKDSDGATVDLVTYGDLAIRTLTTETTNDQQKQETTTDAVGNVTKDFTDLVKYNIIKTTDGKNKDTSYEYDLLNNLKSVSKSYNKVQYTYEHDKIKTISSLYNGNTFITYTFEYTPFGDISAIKVGNITLVSYAYTDNINRLLTSITYYGTHQISYDYDDDFNLYSQKCSNTLEEYYDYDEIGSILKVYDFINETVTVFVNDDMQIWNLYETQLLHSYTYDGDTFKETIGSNTYSTKHESFDKVEDDPETTDIDESQQAKTIVSFDEKTQTTYTDDFGRTIKIVTKHGDTVVMTQEYAYTGSDSYTYTYNDIEYTKTLTSEQIQSITTKIGSTTTVESYTYDANGNILTIRKNGDLVSQYYYDELNQMTTETDYVNNISYGYSYNPAGNVIGIYKFDSTTGSYLGSESYSYDSQWPDRLTNYNGKAVVYNEAGNPEVYKDMPLIWENGRQLAFYGTTEYKYNSDGLRTAKITGGTTEYKFTWAEGKLTHQAWNSNYIHFYYNEADEIIGFEYNGAKYSYVKNLQGDVTGIIRDSDGALIVSYTYDAWGKLLSTTGSQASTIGKINPIRYRGYYYDAETGLFYVGSRYYDPEIGRFLNADVPETMILQADSSILATNLFAYCFNNPVNYADHTGYVVTPANVVGAIIGAGAGALIGMLLASHFKLTGWKKWLVIGGSSALVAIVGWFAGPVMYNAITALVPLLQEAIEKGKLLYHKIATPVSRFLGLLPKCFVAETLIKTQDGDRPIEEIKIGDMVYAEDPETGEKGLKRVTDVYVNRTDKLVDIEINKTILKTTEEHPFWVVDKGWVAAGSLEIGDKLKLSTGEIVLVSNIKYVLLDTPVKVYNFTVEDWHTYYAGELSILTHNLNCNDTAQKVISAERQGKILREFPGQYLNKTIEQIIRDKDKGIKAARTAWKLLNDKRFKK